MHLLVRSALVKSEPDNTVLVNTAPINDEPLYVPRSITAFAKFAPVMRCVAVCCSVLQGRSNTNNEPLHVTRAVTASAKSAPV